MSVVETKGETKAELKLPEFPTELENARAAAKQLLEGIKSLHDDKDHMSFWMGVNRETGKATLIPVPTPANIEKLKEGLNALPENIQKAITKNVPEEHMVATKTLFEAMEQARLADEAKKKAAIDPKCRRELPKK